MRSHSAFLVVASIGITLVSACTKADAAADSAKAASAAKPPALTGALTTSLSPLQPTGDTLSDSLLISRADKGRILGSDSGAIWVVMISDFQCPYCKHWHDSSMAKLKREYVETGKVRLAYLNLPLPQHKFARSEAEAALCAGAQGSFWPFAEQLFARQTSLEKATVVQPVYTPVVQTPVVQTAAVQPAPVAAKTMDLELVEVRQLDRGDLAKDQGPAYRVTLRNKTGEAIAKAFNVSNVTLWPTDERRIYRAQWFNPATETFFEGHVRVYPHG